MNTHITINMLEAVFSMQSVPRIYNDNQENKLRERERERIWSRVPWDPEPRMAVLVKTSTNLHNPKLI
jgi:hypothetical protein